MGEHRRLIAFKGRSAVWQADLFRVKSSGGRIVHASAFSFNWNRVKLPDVIQSAGLREIRQSFTRLTPLSSPSVVGTALASRAHTEPLRVTLIAHLYVQNITQ